MAEAQGRAGSRRASLEILALGEGDSEDYFSSNRGGVRDERERARGKLMFCELSTCRILFFYA